MQLGDVIKKAMYDLRINSIKELAKMAGMDYETVKRVVRNENTSIVTADKVLKPLNLRLTTEKVKVSK